jgi:hypothetical protein
MRPAYQRETEICLAIADADIVARSGWTFSEYSDFLMTKKSAAAVQLGRRGAKATARKRTAEERSKQARKAALARWAKTTDKIFDSE